MAGHSFIAGAGGAGGERAAGNGFEREEHAGVGSRLAKQEEEKDENDAYLHSASVKWIAGKLGLSTGDGGDCVPGGELC